MGCGSSKSEDVIDPMLKNKKSGKSEESGIYPNKPAQTEKSENTSSTTTNKDNEESTSKPGPSDNNNLDKILVKENDGQNNTKKVKTKKITTVGPSMRTENPPLDEPGQYKHNRTSNKLDLVNSDPIINKTVVTSQHLENSTKPTNCDCKPEAKPSPSTSKEYECDTDVEDSEGGDDCNKLDVSAESNDNNQLAKPPVPEANETEPVINGGHSEHDQGKSSKTINDISSSNKEEANANTESSDKNTVGSASCQGNITTTEQHRGINENGYLTPQCNTNAKTRKGPSENDSAADNQGHSGGVNTDNIALEFVGNITMNPGVQENNCQTNHIDGDHHINTREQPQPPMDNNENSDLQNFQLYGNISTGRRK